MIRIYKRKEFQIYSNNVEYIIYNRKKKFEEGHTHIRNYNTAKFLINLAIHKTIPNKKLNKYLYTSLIRITDDKNYKEKIKKEMNKVRG